MTRCYVRWCMILGLLACRAGSPSAYAAPDATAGLYHRGATLVDTLQTTREGFLSWTQNQRAFGAAVTLGPWHFAASSQAAQAAAPDLTQPLDFSVKASGGQPLWTNRPEFKDGQIFRLSTDQGSNVRWLAARILKAREPSTLYVGLGGGQRIVVWLNQQRLADIDTAMTYQRYGTGQLADHDRRDQVICPLPLNAGDNRLVIELHQISVGNRQPLEFYFSATPSPVHALCRQVKADFPPGENRLLQRVSWAWFTPSGWLAQADGQLQQKFLDETLADLGPQAATVQKHLDALRVANVSPLDRRWLELCVQAADLKTALQETARLRQAVEELASDYPEAYPQAEFLSQLAAYRKEWDAACSTTAGAEDRGRRLLAELDKMKRLMLVEAIALRVISCCGQAIYLHSQHYSTLLSWSRAWGGTWLGSLWPTQTGDCSNCVEESSIATICRSMQADRVRYGPEAMAIACMG